MKQWWLGVWDGLYTVALGMRITWRHVFTGNVTLQYPDVRWQLPPKSRMRLFMKYEDCIGCGQCVRACPVNCISLKTDKRPAGSPPVWAADGTAIKLDVKVFDIDMSLCCYCNLCTYPCPTACLYMTPEYEFAATNLAQHLYHFAKQDAQFLMANPKPKPPTEPAPSNPPVSPAGASRP